MNKIKPIKAWALVAGNRINSAEIFNSLELLKEYQRYWYPPEMGEKVVEVVITPV